jgi:hypothetical protein
MAAARGGTPKGIVGDDIVRGGTQQDAVALAQFCAGRRAAGHADQKAKLVVHNLSYIHKIHLRILPSELDPRLGRWVGHWLEHAAKDAALDKPMASGAEGLRALGCVVGREGELLILGVSSLGLAPSKPRSTNDTSSDSIRTSGKPCCSAFSRDKDALSP